jgi:hypothetical protein
LPSNNIKTDSDSDVSFNHPQLCGKSLKGKEGEAALSFAVGFNDNVEVLKTLIQLGVDTKFELADMLLFTAALDKEADFIKVLIDAGFDVNHKTKKGTTVLMAAAENNTNAPVIKVLIDSGADLYAKDEEGLTVIDYARKNSNTRVLTEIVKAQNSRSQSNDETHSEVAITPSDNASNVFDFVSRKRNRYSSENNLKAKGLRFEIDYPLSWTNTEADRPDIVQIFRKTDSDGNLMQCLIAVKDIPSDMSLPHYADNGVMQELVQTIGGTFVEGGSTKIEAIPAGWAIYDYTGERAGFKLQSKNIMYMLEFKRKIVTLHFTISNLNNPTAIP